MSLGIPALLNGAQIPFQILTQARAIANLVLDYFGLLAPSYGIYLNNKPALVVDGFIDFAINNASNIANYRLEKGAFATYNKVITPFEIRAVIVRQGGIDEINACLNSLESISNDLNLYDVVTKDIVYSRCNLERYSYRKESENGVNVLYAELIFKEIMNTAESAFTVPATKTQSAKPLKGGGQVQAVA